MGCDITPEVSSKRDKASDYALVWHRFLHDGCTGPWVHAKIENFGSIANCMVEESKTQAWIAEELGISAES